jgi:hypothetical protein
MISVSGFLRRLSLNLVLANLTDNFREAWEKSGRDINKFRRVTEPFLKRFLETEVTSRDLKELEESILEATDQKVKLTSRSEKWTVAPVHS